MAYPFDVILPSLIAANRIAFTMTDGPVPLAGAMTNLRYYMRINVRAPFFRVKLSFQDHPRGFLKEITQYATLLPVCKVQICPYIRYSCFLLFRRRWSQRVIPQARWHPYDGYHNPSIDMMWWHMSCSRVLKFRFEKSAFVRCSVTNAFALCDDCIRVKTCFLKC